MMNFWNHFQKIPAVISKFSQFQILNSKSKFQESERNLREQIYFNTAAQTEGLNTNTAGINQISYTYWLPAEQVHTCWWTR